MADLALVMPMAGRGSRFAAQGEMRPKPLIEVAGHPFFYWATESVLRHVQVREQVFVVLDEHVREHRIEQRIRAYYPGARILALAEPTAGAAETAAVGVAALDSDGPIAINDCDHAFRAQGLAETIASLNGEAAGALVGFASTNPAYSYVQLDKAGRVVGTAEKQRLGPYAIAGCYLLRDRETFSQAFAQYRQACPYPELFLSGVYNLLCERGDAVNFLPLDRHVSFGTPEELAAMPRGVLDEMARAGVA